MKNLKLFTMLAIVMGLFVTSCSNDSSEVGDNPSGEPQTATLNLRTVLNNPSSRAHYYNVEISADCVDDPIEDLVARIQYDVWMDGTWEEYTVVVPLGMDSDEMLFTEYSEDLEIMIPMDDADGNGDDNTVTIRVRTFSVHQDFDGDGELDNAGDNTGEDVPIWVAPRAGSDYAVFVDEPLYNPSGDVEGLTFDLRAGSKPYQDVEVICLDDREVVKYGYQFFDIIPIRIIEGCFFVNVCDDDGRHYVGEYTVQVYSDDSMDEMLSENTNINPDGDLEYSDPVCVWFPDTMDDDSYYVVVTLEDGTEIFSATLSDDDVLDRIITDMDDPNYGDVEYWHLLYCDGETTVE